MTLLNLCGAWKEMRACASKSHYYLECVLILSFWHSHAKTIHIKIAIKEGTVLIFNFQVYCHLPLLLPFTTQLNQSAQSYPISLSCTPSCLPSSPSFTRTLFQLLQRTRYFYLEHACYIFPSSESLFIKLHSPKRSCNQWEEPCREGLGS